MRVFLTGATGFIGSAIARELLAAGHRVLGLARSDAAADALLRARLEVHRGELTNINSLAAGARLCDGVIHAGYNHDWAKTTREAAAETDRQAVEAMAGALERSGKPLVVTSGTFLTAILAPGKVGTEAVAPTNADIPRAATEMETIAASERGVRASVIRLPLTVHGKGDYQFVPMLIDIARKSGFAAFVGGGANRWPAVHRLDAARLYRLALENAAPGTRLHGVAEEGVPMRAIAETIAAGLGVPARSLTDEEAKKHFGWFGAFVAIDNPSSSAVTRKSLGWSPTGPDLLTDMKENGYFS